MPQLCTFGASSARGFGLTEETGPGLPDDQFNLTTLLLPGNGTNGAQNNTFLDSSTNNFTITRNGNTTQGTFSPFSQTGWSNYFAGGGTYLSTPNSSTVYTNFGTADFCIECWVFPTSALSESTLIANGPDGTTSGTFVLYLYRNGDIQLFYNTGAGVAVLGSGSASSPTINTWSHIALTRQSGTVRCFVNGVSKFSGTVSGNLGTASGTSTIGTRTGQTSSNSWPGNISNLRIVKNAAVYTAAFTPPTAPLTAISGTSLLTCQSNRFVDNSANAFALTVNGNVSVQPFSPFNPTAAYSAATVGGSGYFDGTGDDLTTPSNAAFTYGTGDFTIEGFYFFTGGVGPSGYSYLFAQGGGTGVTSLGIYIQDGVYKVWNGSAVIVGTTAYAQNRWVHVALARSGTTLRLFLNGVLEGTATNSNSIASGGTIGISIGRWVEIADGNWLTGYVSNFRVVKGTAVYTGAFTPPTTPVTAIANTSLLLNYTNAGIPDATAKNVLETVGNAQISTAQSKWGGSSMYFDGSGDYLLVPPGLQFYLSGAQTTATNRDFTIEFWFYSVNTSINGTFLLRRASSNPIGIVISQLANASLFLGAGDSDSGSWNVSYTSGTNAFTINSWNHIALTRQGTTYRFFLNGVELYTASPTAFVIAGDTLPMYIATNGTEASQFPFNGYIQDFRFTIGAARYTANFTPPTQAFPLF